MYIDEHNIILHTYTVHGITFRQEHAVQRFEMENSIHLRWETSNEEYREVLKIANTGKQQILKKQVLDAANERVFYLNTLSHHTGKVTTRLTYTKVHVVDVKYVISIYRRPKASKQSEQTSPAMFTKNKKAIRTVSCSAAREWGKCGVVFTVKKVCDLQSPFWVNEHTYVSVDT